MLRYSTNLNNPPALGIVSFCGNIRLILHLFSINMHVLLLSVHQNVSDLCFTIRFVYLRPKPLSTELSGPLIAKNKVKPPTDAKNSTAHAI